MQHTTNTQTKYDTYCPLFTGFYNTVFEYDNEDSDIEYYNEENKTDLVYDDFNWDYKEHDIRVSKAFANKLESELQYLINCKIDFQELKSPKEYNFSNDTIYVSIEIDIDRLIELVRERKEQAMQYFKDKYTSCSGFISFHSNDVNDWLNKDYILENEGHRVGSLLDCLCSIELDTDNICYWADDENYIDFTPKETI